MPTDVARPFMVRWVVGSILHGGLVLSCLWDGAYKIFLAFNRKE